MLKNHKNHKKHPSYIPGRFHPRTPNSTQPDSIYLPPIQYQPTSTPDLTKISLQKALFIIQALTLPSDNTALRFRVCNRPRATLTLRPPSRSDACIYSLALARKNYLVCSRRAFIFPCCISDCGFVIEVADQLP